MYVYTLCDTSNHNIATIGTVLESVQYIQQHLGLILSIWLNLNVSKKGKCRWKRRRRKWKRRRGREGGGGGREEEQRAWSEAFHYTQWDKQLNCIYMCKINKRSKCRDDWMEVMADKVHKQFTATYVGIVVWNVAMLGILLYLFAYLSASAFIQSSLNLF